MMLEQFFDESPLAMLLLDRNLQITRFNSSAQSYLGNLDLLGTHISELIWPEDRELFSSLLNFPPSSYQQLGRLYHSSGSPLHASIRVSETEETLCWFIEERDEFQQLNTELNSYQNLPKEYGHNINNLLTVIISASELAMMDLDEASPLKEDLTDILEAGYRAAGQTRLFMNLGRKLLINRKVYNINEILENIFSLLSDILGRDSQLELQPSALSASIYVARISLQGAIAQMCAHARMIRPAGDFILAADCLDIAKPFSSYVLGVPAGKYVIITLRERKFDFSQNLLTTDLYHIPDEAEALTLSWEGVVRAKGSIAQRIDKDDNICISIYIPEVGNSL